MKSFLLQVIELVLKVFGIIAFEVIKTVQKARKSSKLHNLWQSTVQTFFEYLIIGFILFYAIIFFPWLGEFLKALLLHIGIKTALIIIVPFFLLSVRGRYKQRVSIHNALESKECAKEKGNLEQYYNNAIIASDCYLDIENNNMKRYQSLSIGSLAMAIIPFLLTGNFNNIFQEAVLKTTMFTEKISKIRLSEIQASEVAYFIIITFLITYTYKYVISNSGYRNWRLKKMNLQQELNEYQNKKKNGGHTPLDFEKIMQNESQKETAPPNL